MIEKSTAKTTRFFLYVILVIFTVFITFPLIYSIFGSFKDTLEFMNGGLNLLPKRWSLQNYIDAVRIAKFGTYTINTIVFASLSVIGVVFTGSLTGYILARKDFFGKKILLGLFAASLFLTGAVTIFPAFDICKRLGLLNLSLIGMTLVEIAWAQPFNCILVMAYCGGIPKSLDESAQLDGCSTFRIYWSIILPIIKPILATVALLEFRSAWNNYMLPLAFTLTNQAFRTLAVGIVSLKDNGEGISAWNLMTAGTVMSFLPILILYVFMNKQFIQGITEGAIKG